MKDNPVIRWLNGEISTGKMLDLCHAPRPSGDDLAGYMWQAIHEKACALKVSLEAKRDRAERDYKEALAVGKTDDAAAESSARLAYTTALSELQLHFGDCIERTMVPR